MPVPPYTCVGNENSGAANIYEDGVWLRAIATSRCFVEWYMFYMNDQTGKEYTWDWRDGDPDAPPPEDPPPSP